MSNYKQLLKTAKIPQNGKILDIGAGGFGGQTTTQFLVQLYNPENITLIEYNKVHFEKLNMFPKCKKIFGDFFSYDFKEEKFDLISVDLDSILQFGRWEEILKICDTLLTKNGYIVAYTIADMSKIKMLNAENENVIKDHLLKAYGIDTVIKKEHLLKYYDKDAEFEFVDSIEKNDLIQWILIKRKGCVSEITQTQEQNIQNKPIKYKGEKPILTVALPCFNSQKIGWLAMESLCNQKDIDFKWELLIMEEDYPEANPFGYEEFKKYEKRLKKVGCIGIQYFRLDKKITLLEKWSKIGKQTHEKSIGFLLQASDCYSYPTRLKMSYDAMINGYDWCQCVQGCFYEVQTGKMIKYNGNTIEWSRNHLNMGFRTEYARLIPEAELGIGIDGYLIGQCQKYKGKEQLKIYNDSTDNWRFGVDSHGANNISIKRGAYFINTTPPFEKTDIKIEDVLPKEIVEKLLTLKTK